MFPLRTDSGQVLRGKISRWSLWIFPKVEMFCSLSPLLTCSGVCWLITSLSSPLSLPSSLPPSLPPSGSPLSWKLLPQTSPSVGWAGQRSRVCPQATPEPAGFYSSPPGDERGPARTRCMKISCIRNIWLCSFSGGLSQRRDFTNRLWHLIKAIEVKDHIPFFVKFWFLQTI